MSARNILITEPDIKKLMQLLELRSRPGARDRQHLEMLAAELEHAEVVRWEEVPPDVVTMHSHVRVRDLDTGNETVYTLVFPGDADIAENKVSVLAPIGTALLGYRTGDEIEWPVPGGLRRLKVVEVLYQPEAAGDEPGPQVAQSRVTEGPPLQGPHATRARSRAAR